MRADPMRACTEEWAGAEALAVGIEVIPDAVFRFDAEDVDQ
jgi:hypothetical protein